MIGKTSLCLLFPLMLPALYASAAKSDVPMMTCGNFHFSRAADNDRAIRINGVKPEVQKITFLKQAGDWHNVKAHWVVAATKFQGKYAMNYLRQGGSGTLHAEILRTSRSQIKISGDYDCKDEPR